MSEEALDMLKGTTLKVYRYMVKHDEPIGPRELQRALGLSSPALADYHLKKLEEMGLAAKTSDGYAVDKVVLRGFIKLRHVLVPRYFFYSVFFTSLFVLYLAIFSPAGVTSHFLFSVAMGAGASLAFWYETIRTWAREEI